MDRDLHTSPGQATGKPKDARLCGSDLGDEVMGEEDDAHRGSVSQHDERERVEAIYDRYSSDPRKRRAWSAENAGNRAIRAELVAAVVPHVPDEGVVLDVGCGTGWWLGELLTRGFGPDRLAGCDLLEARVATTRGRLAGADIRNADARFLPWEDNTVAMVTLFTTLSSMGSDDDRRTALREARRVLRPGGVVLVWEPRVWTGNRQTARVSRRLLRQELGAEMRIRSVTLLPPLARRLPGGRGYTALAAIPMLRSHRHRVRP